MKKILLSTVVAVGLSSALYAGGKLVAPPEVPPIPIIPKVVDNWSGPYVGVSIGYVKGKADNTIRKSSTRTVTEIDRRTEKTTSHTVTTTETFTNTLKPGKVIGGVFVGYNKELENNFLIGIEGAFNITNNKKSGYLVTSNGTQSNISYEIKQKNEVALYARFGKVIDNKYMPYLLGGVSWTKLYGKVSSIPSMSKNTFGATVGAGLEFKLNKNWHARVQYRFTKYKSKTFNFLPNLSATTKYKTHTIQAGISYHF